MEVKGSWSPTDREGQDRAMELERGWTMDGKRMEKRFKLVGERFESEVEFQPKSTQMKLSLGIGIPLSRKLILTYVFRTASSASRLQRMSYLQAK